MSILDTLVRRLKTLVREEVKTGVDNAVKNAGKASKTLTFDMLPENVSQLKELPGADAISIRLSAVIGRFLS